MYERCYLASGFSLYLDDWMSNGRSQDLPGNIHIPCDDGTTCAVVGLCCDRTQRGPCECGLALHRSCDTAGVWTTGHGVAECALGKLKPSNLVVNTCSSFA